jgi:hypothetical protein
MNAPRREHSVNALLQFHNLGRKVKETHEKKRKRGMAFHVMVPKRREENEETT